MFLKKYTLLFFLSLTVFLFSGAVSADDADIQSRIDKASELMNSGDCKSALDIFLEVLKHNSELPDVHYDVAVCLEETGMYSAAADHYEQYINLRPDAEDADAITDAIAELRGRDEEKGTNDLLIIYPVVDFTDSYMASYLVDYLGNGAENRFFHKAFAHFAVVALAASHEVVFDKKYGDADFAVSEDLCVAIPFVIKGAPVFTSIHPYDINADYSGNIKRYCQETESAEKEALSWYQQNLDEFMHGAICNNDLTDGLYKDKCIDIDELSPWADVGKDGLSADSLYSEADLEPLMAFPHKYALIYEPLDVKMTKSAVTVKYRMHLYDIHKKILLSRKDQSFYFDILDKGLGESFTEYLPIALKNQAEAYFENLGIAF